MKLAIVGSRNYTDYKGLLLIVDIFRQNHPVTEIVSGGARGVDSLAEEYAKERNLPITVFKPDWERHGRKAGFVRNVQIVNHCDHLLAFWDEKSKGTKHSIDTARRKGKPCDIFVVSNKSTIVTRSKY